MKLSTREDIEAPLSYVFGVFADTDGWERAALRRGAEVARTDKLRGLAVGMSWAASFVYRGKPRMLTAELSRLDAPHSMGFSFVANNIDGDISIEFVELSARRTRVTIGTELKPRTLAARVFLQSLKLAKGKLERKYDQRIGLLCNDIEDRYRDSKPKKF